MYHEGQRRLQDALDTRRLADRLAERTVHDRITEEDRAFIEARDMVFVATADAEGRPTCSYKGGDPGFVRVIDERTLAIPNFDGNGMFLSWGNVLANPEVGLLFIDWAGQRRVRIDGTASIDPDDPLLEALTGAQFVVRITPRRIYPNCPRYIHRMEVVERSPYVPRPDGPEPPIPDWKRRPHFSEVLPARDRLRPS